MEGSPNQSLLVLVVCVLFLSTDSLMAVVGGLVAAIGILMLWYLCTALYCLRKTRRGEAEVDSLHCAWFMQYTNHHYT